MTTSRVKVKLYGESFKIHSLDIKKNNYNLFKKAAFQLNESLEEALLNASFFSVLNLKEYESVQSLFKLTSGGLINNSKSSIELWQGRKRLQKFSLNDLFYCNTLFPLFSIKRKDLNINTSIYKYPF